MKHSHSFLIYYLKGDSKDLDFALKRANCPLHAVRKLESGDLRPKIG